MRQCHAWERAGATVITRPLQYLPGRKPQEKGIDVQIATDFLAGAYEDQFDIGIIFSADTDLLAPLQQVAGSAHIKAQAEVAAWRSDSYRQRLYPKPPLHLWCHFLDADDYDSVRDLTDYRPRA